MTIDVGQERSDASATDGAGIAIPPGDVLQGITALVVDDSRTVQRSVADHLEAAGAAVLLAEDGFNAIALLVENRPDVLVADIDLPQLDGYQICALMRANADLAATPVVLLSGHDGRFDRARGDAAGASAHLAKPVERSTLVNRLASLLRVDSR